MSESGGVEYQKQSPYCYFISSNFQTSNINTTIEELEGHRSLATAIGRYQVRRTADTSHFT